MLQVKINGWFSNEDQQNLTGVCLKTDLRHFRSEGVDIGTSSGQNWDIDDDSIMKSTVFDDNWSVILCI